MRGLTLVFTALLCMFFVNGALAKNFKDNGNGTVTDNDTGLVWQQGEGDVMNWEMALTYCEGLSLVWEDWRLPGHKELQSLIDYSRVSPALDKAYFPGIVYWLYWSATTSVASPSDAYRVHFNYGGLYVSPKSDNHYVRCVRGGE